MKVKPSYEELERRTREMQESEMYYRTLFESINDAVLVYEIGFDGMPGQFIDANRIALKRLGYTHAELLKLTPKDITTENGYKDLSEARANITSNCAAIFETIHLARNGDLIPVEIHVSVVEIADQRVAVSVIRDLSERNITEKLLKERIKEMALLQSISRIIQEEDSCGSICQKIAYAMPQAWYYPEIACARIICEGQSHQTENFSETKWCLSADLKVKDKSAGVVEVFYLEERPARDEGPFIKEERNLINLCAERLGRVLEHMRAEEALQKSEAKFRSIYEHTAVGLAQLSLDFKIMSVNEAYCNMIGYQEKDLVGRHLKEITYPDVIEENIQKQVNLASGKIDHYRLEKKFIHKNGQAVHAILDANLIRDVSGKAIYFLGSVVDITELKRAEELLDTSQRLGKVGGWGWNVETQTMWWTKETYRIHDLTPEEMEPGSAEHINKSAACYEPEDRPVVLAAFQRCVEEGQPFDLELQFTTAKGRRLWIRTTARPERARGKVIRVIGSIMDITERKRAVDQLRISEEKYRNIFDNMKDVYYETSLDGWILEISPSIEAISKGQYCQADLIGRQMLDFYDDTEERERLITKLLEAGSFSDFEISLRNRDGSLVPCSVSAKLWQDDQGNPVKIIGSMRDNIERKKAEAEREKLQAQLLQAQKMESVGRLAGGVAHDYNNMLSVILGYTEMTMEQVDPNDPMYDNLKEVYTAGKRSMDITSQLLAFARKQIAHPIVMDLNETVDEMLKMLRRLIGEDIDFAWEPTIRLWPVKMDSSQLDQILTNLCVNARDAISGVGKITIETENVNLDDSYCAQHAGFIPGDFVMLAVSDNGCGMDKETLKHIFDPFYTTKDIGKGTGLGLAMIYGIVKQNKGFINVYSELGHGTTFKIYLPRHTVETDEAITEVTHEIVVFGQGETILLVEDEPAIIKVCQTMLEKLGYNVLIAHAPDEAVNLASEHCEIIHLLMSDVIMPGMNGRDLADKLQTIRPDIRVLFMSGYTANVIVDHGVLAKGVHFIQKPFSMKDLGGKVREALEG